MERISIGLLLIRKYNIFLLGELARLVIGEQAKRARRYLVMFMEVRDIYIYIYVRLFLIRMCALSALQIKFKS